MAKYPTVKDGELIKPVRKGYMMACCDCGLVHRMNFYILPYKSGKGVFLRAWRDEKRTKARRKRHGITVRTK